MKGLFRTVLTAFLLLASQYALLAGPGRPWEKLLDRYELICKKCLEMKNLRDAGENVPASQIKDLLSELESLRSQLKGISDKMPAGARRRFDTIRQMYADGMISDTHIDTLKAVAAGLVEGTLLSQRDTASLIPRSPAPGIPIKLRPRWTASASAVVVPDFAWGAMVSCVGTKVGVYLAFRSSFSKHATSYDALSDGSSGDSRIWTSGTSASDALFVTAGPVLPVSKWLSFFGGLGYGSRKLCWEDTDGLWMKVSDESPAGLCTELGAAVHYWHFSLSLSWLAIPLSYGAAAVSIGYTF